MGARTERIIAEELSRMGWNESELSLRRKSDPAKLAIGARLRKETTLSIKGIDTRLHLHIQQRKHAVAPVDGADRAIRFTTRPTLK